MVAQSPLGQWHAVETSDGCQDFGIQVLSRACPKHGDGGQPEVSRLASCIHIATEVWTSCQFSSWAPVVVVGVGRDSSGCS